MVTVRKVLRKSAVLSPSSLVCLSTIPTVNLTMGCAHNCLYCYTRGYRAHPGEGKLDVYENAFEKLREELDRKRRKPKAVYFSPASDLFQPVPEVLDIAYDMIRHLLVREIGIAFLTKGAIPKKHLSLLLAHPSLVHAQIGLITTDETVLQIFEPNAASSDIRIAQMRQLAGAGIRTQVRLDPILPGVTDDTHTFESLCQTTVTCGVNEMAASVLFLRSMPMHRLKNAAKTTPLVARCLKAFQSAHRMAIHAERSSVIALSAPEREAIFRRLEYIAGQHGLVVKRCACKNPDIATGTCSIAGDWPQRGSAVQAKLFNQTGGTGDGKGH